MGEIVIGGAIILLVLLFLRFGNAVTECICQRLDPAPEIINEYSP